MTRRDRLAIMAAILAARLEHVYDEALVVEEAWDLDVAVGLRMKEQSDYMVGIHGPGHGSKDVDPQEFCARVAGDFEGIHYGCDREKGHTGPHTSQTLALLLADASEDDS